VAEWRTIGRLADRVGAYCWLERRLFEVTGAWAAGGGEAAGKGEAAAVVFLASASRRHGALADRWRDRLPVRAGADRSQLVVAPPGPLGGVLEALERTDAAVSWADGVTALVDVVLPRVLATYGAHLGAAAPVCEGPVLAVLAAARLEGVVEGEVGRSVVSGLGCSGDFSRELERKFGGVSGVLPGEWAS
jgi:hypothetical protein